MENKIKGNKLLQILKKYGYYAMAFVLVLGITLAIVFSAVPSPNMDEETPPTDTTPIVFSLPVNSPNVIKWYSDSELMFNDTLKQWESHMAVDLTSDSSDVFAVLGGVVTDVENSYEYGTVITITHEDGFVSKYSSLNETTEVTISDKVEAGDKIGTMSASASNEQLSGEHLHFELFKDGEKVDPANYLTLSDK